jgi:hypothetical protein
MRKGVKETDVVEKGDTKEWEEIMEHIKRD